MFTDVRQRPHMVGWFVVCGRSNERPYGFVGMTGARPAQGVATTTADKELLFAQRTATRAAPCFKCMYGAR